MELNESDHISCNSLQDNAVSAVRQAFAAHDNFEDIASDISKDLNKKYGDYWHCIIGAYNTQYGQYSQQIWSDSHINLRIANISVIIFYSQQRTTFDLINDARNVSFYF